MSTLLCRVLRVYTGWRALPGKNMLICDDGFAVVRASGLVGMPNLVGQMLVRKNKGQEVIVDLEELAAAHPDNWLLRNDEVTSAESRWRFISGFVTLRGEEREEKIKFERRPNPRAAVDAALAQALGIRFTPG